jgi:hypothetical protein
MKVPYFGWKLRGDIFWMEIEIFYEPTNSGLKLKKFLEGPILF